jgi:antitoxin Phd
VGDVWQWQEAKDRLDEMIEKALTDGPQVIVRQGVKTAVLLPYADYQRQLLQQQKLSEFFRQSPLVDAGLDLSRIPH